MVVCWLVGGWKIGWIHLKEVVGQLLSEELIPLAQPLVHLQGKPMVVELYLAEILLNEVKCSKFELILESPAFVIIMIIIIAKQKNHHITVISLHQSQKNSVNRAKVVKV